MSTRLEVSSKNQTQRIINDVDNPMRQDTADSLPLDLKSPVLMDLRHRIVSTPIRVMIADEDKLFTEGIVALIDQWHEFQLIARATNPDEVLKFIIEYDPTIILMGVRMQGVKCSETIRAITANDLETRVIVIASRTDAADVLDALRAGAMGYGVREELSADRLRGVLWGVAAGEVVLAGSVGTRLQEELVKPADARALEDGFFSSLTKREREVLALLVEGMSNAEISHQLYLSEPTIKKIISQVTNKLQVTNRVQAAVLATRHMMVR
ncbi:MAG TPA: response regulator transcription factor [Syntrophomonas sp.]|nr:response regulator transcription factor [Syntrophomonas sp.]